MSTRIVVVDDTSPNINYAGTWFQDRGSKDSLGTYGAPYQSTLHGTTTNGSSFSFAFNGISVDVFATLEIANNSGVIDPQWECFIDGSQIPTYSPSTAPTNHWTLCGFTFSAGPHVLTVNATVREQTFWFDSIQYTSSGGSTTNQSILIDERDEEFRAGLSEDVWHFTSGVGYSSQVPNAAFTFNFSGSSLEYYGFIPDNFPRVDATATWAVDGGTPQEFALEATPPGTPLHRFQKFFQTDVYPIGDHRLQVVYQGDSTKTPLTLTNVIVGNGTTTTSTGIPSGSSAGAGPTGTSGTSGAATSGKSTNLGAILGGVLGGLALILLVALLFWLRRRRRRRAEPQEKPNTTVVQPFEPTTAAALTAAPPLAPSVRTKGQLSLATNESDFSRTTAVTSPQSAGTALSPSAPSSSPAPAHATDNIHSESDDPRVIVVHADSGVRLSQVIPPHARVEEVPPTYSA
ncbi:hypothetical protein NLJ89_g2501 [Agrocybe chaxingu]|uniref:Uncharacterized protein n=1 Tax=Agrocybe chaxingu TaxID=84603 RepID=A0A9W8K6P0_9AGAR|nr:hypothetical protein NLJ89_g2501 [Agrocybe chaxingu]